MATLQMLIESYVRDLVSIVIALEKKLDPNNDFSKEEASELQKRLIDLIKAKILPNNSDKTIDTDNPFFSKDVGTIRSMFSVMLFPTSLEDAEPYLDRTSIKSIDEMMQIITDGYSSRYADFKNLTRPNNEAFIKEIKGFLDSKHRVDVLLRTAKNMPAFSNPKIGSYTPTVGTKYEFIEKPRTTGPGSFLKDLEIHEISVDLPPDTSWKIMTSRVKDVESGLPLLTNVENQYKHADVIGINIFIQDYDDRLKAELAEQGFDSFRLEGANHDTAGRVPVCVFISYDNIIKKIDEALELEEANNSIRSLPSEKQQHIKSLVKKALLTNTKLGKNQIDRDDLKSVSDYFDIVKQKYDESLNPYPIIENHVKLEKETKPLESVNQNNEISITEKKQEVESLDSTVIPGTVVAPPAPPLSGEGQSYQQKMQEQTYPELKDEMVEELAQDKFIKEQLAAIDLYHGKPESLKRVIGAKIDEKKYVQPSMESLHPNKELLNFQTMVEKVDTNYKKLNIFSSRVTKNFLDAFSSIEQAEKTRLAHNVLDSIYKDLKSTSSNTEQEILDTIDEARSYRLNWNVALTHVENLIAQKVLTTDEKYQKYRSGEEKYKKYEDSAEKYKKYSSLLERIETYYHRQYESPYDRNEAIQSITKLLKIDETFLNKNARNDISALLKSLENPKNPQYEREYIFYKLYEAAEKIPFTSIRSTDLYNGIMATMAKLYHAEKLSESKMRDVVETQMKKTGVSYRAKAALYEKSEPLKELLLDSHQITHPGH